MASDHLRKRPPFGRETGPLSVIVGAVKVRLLEVLETIEAKLVPLGAETVIASVA